MKVSYRKAELEDRALRYVISYKCTIKYLTLVKAKKEVERESNYYPMLYIDQELF